MKKAKQENQAQSPLAPELDAIGAIELDDAMLEAEIEGGVAAASSTNTWICHPGVCCNITG